MESIYVLAIGCGFVMGAFLGRFITKLKLALIFESRLKKKRTQMSVDTVKVEGG